MKISILNSFSGDNEKDIDTTNAEGRTQAAKLVGDLIRNGSAVFLEREIGEKTYTYRVTGYDPETNKLMIRLDSSQMAVEDAEIEVEHTRKNAGRKGRKLGPYRRHRTGAIDAGSGRTVAVAPRSGG